MIVTRIQTATLPRLPLDGSLDLTYRCNLDCRHCWLRLSPGASERANELSFDEIRRLADEARAQGCRRWAISGGEPMLRSDFAEVFDYLTSRSVGYSLNTNGTLITPAIARLLVRKGTKMVALYGATAEVCDHITRTPGSFESAMRGFAYLKEAGVGFIVQLIPMRDNWHQYDELVALARRLSPHYRMGAAWLHLSECASPARNAEIRHQRLAPRDAVEIDFSPPLLPEEPRHACRRQELAVDDRLFASCIEQRNEFHIDAYGGMSFCCYAKDSSLRYDLRRGSFQQAWEVFLPSLARSVRGGPEYVEGCGACDVRADCRWCGAFAHLEHGRPGARVEYLCQLAREIRARRAEWKRSHRSFFEIAGVTVQVDADVPMTESTFAPKFADFAVAGPGYDTISIHHHFGFPDLCGRDLGREVYRKPPWAVFRKGDSWLYLGIPAQPGDTRLYRIAEFNHDHSQGHIYSPNEDELRAGGRDSLTMFPTDEIVLARVLAGRQACIVHSGAAAIDGAGLLFAGPSGVGKSTLIEMLAGKAEVIGDDRNIVRCWPDGFRVHGTWIHGKVPFVSAASAPLAAVVFPTKAEENRLVRLVDSRRILAGLLGCVMASVVDAGWWEQVLEVLGSLVRNVPCYEMRFDRSGAIVPALLELARAGGDRWQRPEISPQTGS